MAVNGNYIVIDASVVMAWLSPDEKVVDSVNKLFERSILGKTSFAAPGLLKYEIWNGILNLVKRKRIGINMLKEALESFNSLRIKFFDQEVDGLEVVHLAKKHDLSAYDASYLALSRSLKVELVTLDNKLKQVADNL